jgi:DNA-binding transcriptional LysR family regulator
MDATIDGLRTLAALRDARSMAVAARQLGIDKATVSRRLALLERAQPGLFERRAGQVAPTPAGARALEALAVVERELAALRATLVERQAARGAVRLTVPAPIAAHIVIPALPAFRRAHPEIEVVLLATSRVLDIGRGEADVAVRNLPPQGAGVVARKVARVAYTLYAARDYLARRGPPPLRSLDGHDIVDFEAGTPGAAPLDWLPAAVRRARVVLRADDPALLTRAVAAGLGIGALPAFLADDEPGLVRVGPDVVVAPVHVVVNLRARQLARVRAVASWIGQLMTARLVWLERAPRTS